MIVSVLVKYEQLNCNLCTWGVYFCIITSMHQALQKNNLVPPTHRWYRNFIPATSFGN